MATQVAYGKRSGWVTFAATVMFAIAALRFISAISYFADSHKVNDLTGGLFPLLTMLLAPDAARIAATFAIVVVALAATGFISARLGRSKRRIGVLRNVVGGALAMAITYGIGSLVGTAV